MKNIRNKIFFNSIKSASKQSTQNYREEIKLLYQLSTVDITNAKKEQFEVANYTFAIQAVIFYVSKNFNLESAEAPIKIIACAALVLVSIFFTLAAIYHVGTIQKNIVRFRSRIYKIRAKFSNDFREAFGAEETAKYTTIKYRPEVYNTILWLLRIVLFFTPLLIMINLELIEY